MVPIPVLILCSVLLSAFIRISLPSLVNLYFQVFYLLLLWSYNTGIAIVCICGTISGRELLDV